MEINKYMFREYDIRGVYGKDINEEVSYLLGRAFGTKLKRLGKKETLVGYDNRYSSKTIEENLVKGITESGIDVVRLGLVTTPMYYYSWDLLNVKCGIMITASHNPKDDNGFKFSYNGIHNAYGDASMELYNLMVNKDFEEGNGNTREVNVKEDYIKMVTEKINIGNHRIKVVYDCGNGTTSIDADEVLNTFKDKIDLVPLFNTSDSSFPNHHPDPAEEENLSFLKDKVKETNADVGIAFDGDGDRLGVITNTGRFLAMEEYMILIWRDLVKKKDVAKKTFYDIKCSLYLKEELDKLGVENDFYRTGNSYVKAKSALEDYPFAGELSGHLYFRDKFGGYDDGVYAGLRLIEILTNTDKNIEELLSDIKKYIITPEIKVAVSDDIKFKVVEKINEYAVSKNYNILTIDGVKVLFDDGSAIVRASNTGPNITTRFEAKTEERLEEIKKEFMDLVDSEIKKLS